MIVLIGMLVGVWIWARSSPSLHQRHDEPVRHHDGAAQPETKKTDWTSFIYGCIAGLFRGGDHVGISWLRCLGDAKPPAFVYAIHPHDLCVL